ncbi:MAG: lipopolysaccharide biosynthesis protein [Lachnospiraceae bacterium]|nr:lipopolysaccharide biosynthesis protein [Lachnospiraceae bacterium]
MSIKNKEEGSSDKNKDGLLSSFIKYFYGNFVVLLLGLIQLPLTTRVLKTEEYGKTTMFTTAVSVIYIFAILGLDQAYIRYFYKEGVKRKTLFVQCLMPPLILILILTLIYTAFSDHFNDFLFGENGLSIIIPVVAYTVISVFERFLFLNIRMEQNGVLYSNLNILSKVLNISFIILLAGLLGSDFRVVMYAMTLSLGTVTLITGIRYLYVTKDERVLRHNVSERELLRYGIPFIPMLLMEWLLSSMDKWSIKIFNDFSETGIYGSAMQIMTIILTVKITFVAFWSPVAMEKYEKLPDEECKLFFAEVFDKVQFLCMCAAFMLTSFRGVIVLILGRDYREAVSIIPFLTLMPILSIMFEMTGQGVKFTGKIKYFNYASLAAIICNLIGNAILVPLYKGVGAALATAITYIVYFAIGTMFSKKCYPVDYRFGEFVISLLLYVVYAFYATVTKDQIISALVGIVMLIICCFINRRTLKSLWSYVAEFVKNTGKKRA